MTTPPELAQVISTVKGEIASYQPREQATCLMLIEASLRANAAADAWSEECGDLANDIIAALNGPDGGLRSAVFKALKNSSSRMATRLGRLKEDHS